MARYSIGVDYGTNSVRALVVDVDTGEEIATSVFVYPSGEKGVLLDPRDPNLARQHPGDYLVGFKAVVREAVDQAMSVPGFAPQHVVGLGVDCTGSSPLPVDREGTALGVLPPFRNRLAAQCWLWKDHTSWAEAAEITDKAAGYPYLAKYGGTYSSEWFWSKIWHCKREDPEVFAAAYSWVELTDFVPAAVTGNPDPLKMRRSVCPAGHKAMYHTEWGGLPSKEYLASLDPDLADLRDRLYTEAVPSDHVAGGLSPEYAEATGLPIGLPVAVGIMDAHAGAVASQVKPGTLVKIIGTSTCDCMVHPADKPLADVPGLCGIVPGSIIPGMIGLEAGQSAVGDIFNWFVDHLSPGLGHAELTAEAEKLKPGESGLVALDWNNGNRTILVDPLLTGLLVGQTLHTTAPEVYRALVEATAYGARRIIERFEEYGVKVDRIVNCGGIAEKNPMVMQIYADVTGRPIEIAASAQACALGAAIFGAVAGKAHADTLTAQSKMAGVKPVRFDPIPDHVKVYERLYSVYLDLHDAFGKTGRTPDLSQAMKTLIAIRRECR
jgi:L-ribulokinase